jgi:hypothetical protein
MKNAVLTKTTFMSIRRQTTHLVFHFVLFAIGAFSGIAIINATRKAEPPSETRIVAIQLRYNFVTVAPEFDDFEELIDSFRRRWWCFPRFDPWGKGVKSFRFEHAAL